MSVEDRPTPARTRPQARYTDAPVPVPRPRVGLLPEGVDESDRWPTETVDTFFGLLAELGNVTQAAKRCGLCKQSLYEKRAREPEFRARWDHALWLGTQGLLDEAKRRAADGTLEPVYQKGVRALDFVYDEDGNRVLDEDGQPKLQAASVRKYSDPLLIQLLKAYLPEFREKLDLNHGGEVRTSPEFDMSKLSTEELRRFRELYIKARREADDGAVDVTPERPSSEDG